MLKRVVICDSFIIVLSFIVSMMFFKEFAIAVIVGIVIAFFNYLMNSLITGYGMNASAKGAIWILFGFAARIAIAGAFALILYNGNRYNIVAYIIGYSLHYIALVAGAASWRNRVKREGQ